MRKSIYAEQDRAAKSTGDWLDLEQLAQVQVSSEDERFPVEHALGATENLGWRSAAPGPQVIRVVFDEAQRLGRIALHFVERTAERSQEFAVVAEMGGDRREIVRQQWTFSPGGATEEMEEYAVDLNGVTAVELRIDPDRSHDPRMSANFASLASFKLG